MATKTPRRKSSPKRPRTIARKPRPAVADLLVIECDADRLAAQGLALGTPVTQLLRRFFPKKRIELLRTSTHQRVASEFASAPSPPGGFTTILLVGHSNSQGLQLADGPPTPWPVVGEWLKPFEPRNVLLLSCSGGRFGGADALFRSVKHLRHVYGSPIEISPLQAAPLLLAVIGVMKSQRIPKDLKMIVQVTNFVATGGILYHWRRQQTLDGQAEGVAWDFLADTAKGLHERARR